MKIVLLRSLVLVAVILPLPAWAQRETAYLDQINQLQQQVTMLTGQIEQLQYQNQQLKEQMEKMRTDYDFRIDQMEKGGRGGGAGPGPAARSTGPAPQQTLQPPSQASAGPAPAGNSDQLYHDAMKLMQDGDYAGAERTFKTFIQRNPQHVLAGNAQYWLGETYYARHDYQSAMTAFAEGYKVYKTSNKGPDNLLKLGITLAALNRKTDACAVFSRFTQDYPKATDLQKRRIDQER
ncbi:MAG: tol-pal system protein YbgF, partial [Alphaproteobacteria bacterium]|nr:tol-pal system protein YbgF [Alphaproteobacteria bacterium]